MRKRDGPGTKTCLLVPRVRGRRDLAVKPALKPDVSRLCEHRRLFGSWRVNGRRFSKLRRSDADLSLVAPPHAGRDLLRADDVHVHDAAAAVLFRGPWRQPPPPPRITHLQLDLNSPLSPYSRVTCVPLLGHVLDT